LVSLDAPSGLSHVKPCMRICAASIDPRHRERSADASHGGQTSPSERLAARGSGRRMLSMTRSPSERAVAHGRRSLTVFDARKIISQAVRLAIQALYNLNTRTSYRPIFRCPRSQAADVVLTRTTGEMLLTLSEIIKKLPASRTTPPLEHLFLRSP
jgi:hypothetical protein